MIFRTANLLSTTSRAGKHLAVRRSSAALSTVALQRASTTTPSSSAALLAAAAAASLAISSTTTHNHCQVPCGIFDDPAMIAEVKQAATTVRKAMVQSSETLFGEEVSKGPLDGIQLQVLLSVNQVVRWVTTKEEHCDKIIHIMSDYCLCQRVKPASFSSKADYLQALELHHAVMQAAMKAKQTMDVKACNDLDHALADLAKMYT